ncbi:MAG: phnA protein [Proteobacteria bacterium]|nr:phnA protein [Pseudomonadota bacterium]MBU1640427.1 phnA protein [Pseudomonadota bacterium]
MAKGVSNKKARIDALAHLGKDLTRRCRAHCELCGHGNRGLEALEVEPLPAEPDLDHTMFICEQCRQAMRPKELNHQYWRFLETTIWSDLPAVQVTAVRLTRRLSVQGEEWATSLLEGLYLSPAIIEWLNEP